MDSSREQLIASITAVVERSPSDPVLRLHLAEILLDGGDGAAAIPHIATALQQDPASEKAKELMSKALGTPAAPAASAAPTAPAGAGTQAPPQPPSPPTPAPGTQPAQSAQPPQDAAPQSAPPGMPQDGAPADFRPEPAGGNGFGFSEGGGTATLTRDEGARGGDPAPSGAVLPPLTGDGLPDPLADDDFPTERENTTLADVAGMEKVKERINAAFLMPMRNEELRKAFSKSLRGGLLLYGPPGCGKTYIARAIAGEMGARFLYVSVADILDGKSSRNVQALFRQARQYSPCVVFMDELDAMGGRRGNMASWLRPVVTQLLTELDSVEEDNEGVFFLAATNHPWDIDSALKRPGRLDRMLFVPPPDEKARAAIVGMELKDRPSAGIDTAKIAKHTDGFSGADITHLVESAAERAMLDSARTGAVRPIGMDDFRAALGELRPSTGPWMETARNMVEFGSADGAYDELADFIRRHRSWR
ncbi:ATP-binding protein [Nocardiopsis chromatogenes]|uniref:ATP-binding protein n=1 Tax=Nocardiopsis chromatogenes TaxID=280239 RepID=UPI000347C304|nr:ATP-binding protein [Nocardiopsis chromatogenes]